MPSATTRCKHCSGLRSSRWTCMCVLLQWRAKSPTGRNTGESPSWTSMCDLHIWERVTQMDLTSIEWRGRCASQTKALPRTPIGSARVVSRSDKQFDINSLQLVKQRHGESVVEKILVHALQSIGFVEHGHFPDGRPAGSIKENSEKRRRIQIQLGRYWSGLCAGCKRSQSRWHEWCWEMSERTHPEAP